MLNESRKRIGASLLAVAALAAIISGVVYAAGSGETKVRVAAQRLEDGRVEVAIQQIDADGAWGDAQRPQFRFLSADSVGEWRVSSPVTVAVAISEDSAPVGPPGGIPPGAMPSGAEGQLNCIVHHGSTGDPFWGLFDTRAVLLSRVLGVASLEIHNAPDVADQAAAIMDCAQRGALTIASTVPDIDGLRDTLAAARDLGSFLITFNSGGQYAAEVGSVTHFGLDDQATGVTAANEFNRAGATGTILCIIHEEQNVGLVHRCDGLESAYDGVVERVQLPDGSITNPDAITSAVGEAIAKHEAAGVFLLNPALNAPVLQAEDDAGVDLLVGVVGGFSTSTIEVIEGRLLFAIYAAASVQARSVAQLMATMNALPPQARLGVSLGAGTRMSISSSILTQDSVALLLSDEVRALCDSDNEDLFEYIDRYCEE